MNSPVSIARLFSEDYGYGDSGGADYGYGDSGGADYGVRYPLFAVFVNRCQCSEPPFFLSSLLSAVWRQRSIWSRLRLWRQRST